MNVNLSNRFPHQCLFVLVKNFSLVVKNLKENIRVSSSAWNQLVIYEGKLALYIEIDTCWNNIAVGSLRVLLNWLYTNWVSNSNDHVIHV